MRVGTGSSAASGITWRLGACHVRHVEAKDLWIQEKVTSHELKVTKGRVNRLVDEVPRS